MCELFGKRLSLQSELRFSLQFARADLEQLQELGKHDVPPEIAALNKEILDAKTDEQKSDPEYQFSVIYTMVSTSKSKSHFQFIGPDSPEGNEINNILVKHKPADDLYPHKAEIAAGLVAAKIGQKFSVSAHTAAWKKHKVRPTSGKPDPKATNSKYCIYHKAHKDYTYNDEWVDFLVQEENK